MDLLTTDQEVQCDCFAHVCRYVTCDISHILYSEVFVDAQLIVQWYTSLITLLVTHPLPIFYSLIQYLQNHPVTTIILLQSVVSNQM